MGPALNPACRGPCNRAPLPQREIIAIHISSYGASVMFRALRWIALVVSTAGLSTVMVSVPVQARAAVAYSGPEAPGRAAGRTQERLLYSVVGEARAIRYSVGGGRS